MKLIKLTLAVACLAFAHHAVGSPQNQKDIVKKKYTVKGQFIGFEVGDYMHAIIKDLKGEEVTFFIGGAGTDYFLALHAKKRATFMIEEVSSYIPEAGGRQTIERIASVKVGSVSSTTWWKAQRKKYSLKKLDEKYGPMVTKLIKDNG